MSVAIVTGANKGIGYEVSKQLVEKGYTVIALGRKKQDIISASETIKNITGKDAIIPFVCDITIEDHIEKLSNMLEESFPEDVEILVNNAGVFYDKFSDDPGVMNLPLDTIRSTLETNTFGPFRLCQKISPLLLKHGEGRIVNVSSGLGQLSDMGTSSAAYRISKTALNAVTRIFSAELINKNICVNSVCPGWVKTDMGTSNATRTVEKGAETIVWAATLPDGGPTGKFFRDKTEISW